MTSELDQAMKTHMERIVFKEQRPFCYLDFQKFEVNDIEYKIAHGTFRNKISKLMRNGEVYLICYSPQGFYSIKGAHVPDGTRRWKGENILTKILDDQELKYFKNKPIYRELNSLPFGEWGLHNIHLRFQCEGLWNLLRSSEKYECIDHSLDIIITKFRTNNLDIITTVHHKDTVTVVVGCSYDQVILDKEGIERLDHALSELETEIRLTIHRISKGSSKHIIVPPHPSWIVTMWHFATDSSNYYSGEKFSCTWKFGKRILISIYTKWWPEDKRRVRMEIQERPKIALSNAIKEKLKKIKSSQ
jgi:hypothetical protein